MRTHAWRGLACAAAVGVILGVGALAGIEYLAHHALERHIARCMHLAQQRGLWAMVRRPDCVRALEARAKERTR